MMTDIPSTVLTAPTASGRRRLEETSPLQWWRQNSYPPPGPADLAKLRKILSQIALPGQRGWNAAVQGDAVAAVQVALRVGAISKGGPDRRLDCAASAALLCALAGNAAAATALAHLRRRFGTPPIVRSEEG
jgi:hypothetical protein